ncbi:MAG: tetratricopeptide repeat protein [Eubacteriales bacterium]|nr:tetratricopeptide repeat protein [Eubacteriales bacterium]
MKVKTSFKKIANAYYNVGLQRAQLNDLTGAAGYLKEALHFDKYCTDARNLLGLIFYEMGETADALVQWIVSYNFDPDPVNNRADYFLEEIQRKTAVIENDSELVKRFNQALFIAQNGGEDFAIIELRDITKKKPNFVKAQLLLAVLYMQNGDNIKAGRALLDVLEIDHNNPQASVLMEEVKKLTGKAEIENAKLHNAFSHRELEDGDVIIPKAEKNTAIEKVAIFIVIGIMLGILSFYILVLPTIKKDYTNELNSSIAKNSTELSSLNADYSDLQQRFDQLSSDYELASQKLNAYEQENASFTSMYEALNMITEEFNGGNIEAAVDDYLKIDRTLITSEPLLSQLHGVDRLIVNDAFNRIVENGTSGWNSGKLDTAEYYYKLALQIKGDDPEVLYLLARLYQSQSRVNEANELFDRIVGEHPESPYAARAVDARGY